MSAEPLMVGAVFRLLRETHDLKVAEAIKAALDREGIGAAIIGDEEVQNLPPNERYAKAERLRERFRVEVPVQLHPAAGRILRKLESIEE
jgi:hypothetical protein